MSKRDPILHLAGWTILAAVLFIFHDLGRADLTRPIAALPTGDVLYYGFQVKVLLETGWVYHHPDLSYPHGLDLYDFAHFDALHLACIKLIGYALPHWGTALNAYYLLGFPLALSTALLLLRHLELPPLASLGAALVFALQPFHFERGQGHVMLSAYWHVPLLLFGVVWLLRPEAMRPRVAGAIAFLGAFGGHYYACYAAVAYLVAGAYRGSVDGSWTPLRRGAMLTALVALGFAVNLVPNLLYWSRQGVNRVVSAKPKEYVEAHALKLTPMLLPSPRHVLRSFRELRREYNRLTPAHDEWQSSIGLLAGLGLIGLLGVAAFGRRGADDWLTGLGVVAAVGLACATVGGFGTLFGYLVTPQLHAHTRAGVLFALLGLIAAAAAARRLPPRWGGVVVVAVTALAVADVVPGSNPFAPAKVNGAYEERGRVARSARATLGAGAAVYVLPASNFPFDDFAYLTLFLESDGLRWSAPAMQFRRTAALNADLETGSADEFLRRLAVHGYDGLVIDTKSRWPGPMTAAALSALRDETPTASGGGLLFYDLRVLNARHSIAADERQRSLLAAGVRWAIDAPAAGSGRRAQGAETVVTVTNFAAGPVDYDLDVTLSGAERFEVNGRAAAAGRSTHRLTLPPGRHPLRLRRADGIAGFTVVRLRLTPTTGP